MTCESFATVAAGKIGRRAADYYCAAARFT
jgi:hypothetical protein